MSIFLIKTSSKFIWFPLKFQQTLFRAFKLARKKKSFKNISDKDDNIHLKQSLDRPMDTIKYLCSINVFDIKHIL